MSEYVIKDKSGRFIMKNRFGKYVPVTCEAMADKFNRVKAESICKNQLPKALRTVFYIEKYGSPPPNVKQVTKEDLLHNTEKVTVADNIQHWIEKAEGLNGLATDALKRKEDLLTLLSHLDRELSDIYHYIEFVNLNAAQGYKAYKMIQERRIKRRSAKNELQVLGIILGKKISETVNDEIVKCLEEMDMRKYEPRVLTELFDF